jgi:hypothetical protein
LTLSAEQLDVLKSGKSITVDIEGVEHPFEISPVVVKGSDRIVLTTGEGADGSVIGNDPFGIVADDGTVVPARHADPAEIEQFTEFRQDTADKLQEMGGNLPPTRNLGWSVTYINGERYVYKAASSLDPAPDDFVVPVRSRNGQELVGHPTQEDWDSALENGTIPKEFRRDHDTEITLLRAILKRTVASDKGEITLYTERYPCDSCVDVVAEFEKLRPNIKVNVVFERIPK